MTAPILTEAEQTFLLQQPNVANTLARFNRAQAYQTADNAARLKLLERKRMFELMDRGRYGK